MVQRWRSDLDPFNEDYRKLAVWVRIPGLRLEYYNRSFLWRVGNVIGRMLKVDMHTLYEQDSQPFMERDRFARICVEVDLWKKPIPKIIFRKRTYSFALDVENLDIEKKPVPSLRWTIV